MNLHEMYAQRAILWADMRGIYEAAQAENRDLTQEEVNRYNALEADLEAKTAAIRAAERHAAHEIVMAELRPETRVAQVATATQAEVNDEAHRAAFNTYLRTGNDAELRAMSKTGNAGGYTVPEGFHADIVKHLVAAGTMRQTRATVLATGDGRDLPIPKTTANGAAVLVSEAGSITATNDTFAVTTLNAFKYGIAVLISRELLEDTGVDIEGFVARQSGEAIGRLQNTHFVAGDGSSKPQGISGASAEGKVGASGQTATLIAADLIDLYYSVNTAYRANGEWMMGDGTAKAIRKLVDDNGQYLWTPGLREGEPDTLLGKPVHIDPDMPAMAASAKSIVFGDFSRYYIRDVKAVQVRRTEERHVDTDQVGFYVVMRSDGDLVDATGAVKHYVNAAS